VTTLTQIEEKLKIAEAATPGEWFTSGESYEARHGREYEVSTEGGLGIWIAHCQNRHDAAFIAESRTGYPAALRALRIAVRVLERIADNPTHTSDGYSNPSNWISWAKRVVREEGLAAIEKELA
jgi:hypothetical protein